MNVTTALFLERDGVLREWEQHLLFKKLDLDKTELWMKQSSKLPLFGAY